MEKYLNSKVLVVDDEYANIFFLKKVLTSEGYRVITAKNGRESLELLDNEKVDVALLDIMMPEMTGLELLEKMKEQDVTKDIPVIMVSAKTDSSDIENALDLGAIEYIKKPVDEIELLARLRTALRIKKYEEQLHENIKAKEDFIRIVAHDLRTPFSSISGFAKFLKDDEDLQKYYSDEHHELFDYILSSASFLVEYFNKLLNWSQIGSNSIKLNKKEVNLDYLLKTVFVIFKSKLQERNIEIKTEIDPNEVIYVDEIYFGQVINNIINNAIKFSPDNSTIHISLNSKDENKKIKIKDFGPGIPPETIEKLMNNKNIKSTQGAKGEKGTGLGLKICKKIIQTHGFDFEILSEAGKGTEFVINCD